MMLANVEGRPIPFSSRALTRLASVKRGFGDVACPLPSTSLRRRTSPTASAGSDWSSALSASPRFSSWLYSYASRNPRKVYTVPDAVNSAFRPSAVTSSVTVVVSYLASDIWLAMVRFQMRS